jgi:large subunit ribosomal protein L13e
MAAEPKVFKTREKKRNGKGFSREELKKAGTNMNEAVKLRIPVDPRRKTAHDENVEIVKTFITHKKAEQKPRKQKPKKPEKSTRAKK